MRALVWASLVMMPDWEPVKLTAGTERAFRAMESRAMDMRSPAESNMSSSRRAGLGEIRRARLRSSSVVSPIAETTTTTSLPVARVAAIRSATCRMRSTSATEEPPYFWTTTPKATPGGHCSGLSRARAGRVRALVVGVGVLNVPSRFPRRPKNSGGGVSTLPRALPSALLAVAPPRWASQDATLGVADAE